MQAYCPNYCTEGFCPNIAAWKISARPPPCTPIAVVTPLRKAASYEQRKTNLGNHNFWRRIIT